MPLRPLFLHHFNLTHLIGVLNWHLPCHGMHKHSFINLPTLTFPLFICLPQSPPFNSYFLVCFNFSLFSLPFLLSPLFPFATSPLLSVSLLRTTPPTLMNISASFILCNHVRPTLGSWGGRMVFVMHPLHKDKFVKYRG